VFVFWGIILELTFHIIQLMENQSKFRSAQSILTALQIVVFSVVILYFGRSVFIPLGFSFLLGIIIYPLCKWLEKKGLHRNISIALPLISFVLLALGLFYLLGAHLLELSHELVKIKPRLMEAVQDFSIFLADNFRLSTENQTLMLKNMVTSFGKVLLDSAGRTVSSLSGSLFFLVMIPVFSYLILLYRLKLVNSLLIFFPDIKIGQLYQILTEVISSYFHFIKGMASVYLIVGILNSLGLLFIGVPHPFVFGFLASILTFIPYVGIMVASLLPISAAWITYDSIWYSVAVIVWFSMVQVMEAYFIFPYIIGKQLKINTLIVFLVIILGGLLWGAAGMILFIPAISIVKLITNRMPELKNISELLGE
jgi:predicted PurR-regulated permease PerM